MCRTFKSQPQTDLEQLGKISRFGGGVLSRHWNIFIYHNLPSFPEEVPNYWDRNRGGNQHDCNSANQFLYVSFCKCVCCIYLLTIYLSKCRMQISNVYTSQICASFSTGSGSGGRRSRINSLANRTDCKPPPKDWSLDESGPLVVQGGGRDQKKTIISTCRSWSITWDLQLLLEDSFLEFSGLVPTDAQETKISKISLNWLTQWYPTPISPTCHGDQCCDK